MIRVNLLATTPGKAPAREWLPREHRSAIAGVALLFMTAIGMGGWWWSLDSERASVDLNIANSEAEIERLKGVAKLVEYATARKAELSERLNLIERLRTTERDPVTMLETVSRSLPDGLWLLDITQKGTSVQFEGRATSLTSITDFAEHLQESGFFERPVEIISTNMETFEDASVVRFAMKASAIDRLKGQAVAAATPAGTAAPATGTAPAAPAAGKGL